MVYKFNSSTVEWHNAYRGRLHFVNIYDLNSILIAVIKGVPHRKRAKQSPHAGLLFLQSLLWPMEMNKKLNLWV